MSTGPDSAVDPLPVLRAAELTEPDVTRRWLIEHLWTRAGVGMIGGLPKSAKSWLALDMAVSVATDTPCLDTFEVHDSGTALIYMAEDAASVVKQRLLGLCQHRRLDLSTAPIDVITANSLRLDLAADRRRLSETIRQRRPRLLLLDPLVRCHRLDENDAGQVSGLLAYLRDIQRSHDVAVVVVHHVRKNASARHGGQSLRGSGDFHAWIDSGLYLRRQRDELLLTVEHRCAPPPPPVALALVDTDQPTTRLRCLKTCDADIDATRADLDAAIVQLLLAAKTPLSRPALRAQLRVRNARLGDALTRLVASGQIVKADDGWRPHAVPSPTPTQMREREPFAPLPAGEGPVLPPI